MKRSPCGGSDEEKRTPVRKQVRVCMALTPNAGCLSAPPGFQERNEDYLAPGQTCWWRLRQDRGSLSPSVARCSVWTTTQKKARTTRYFCEESDSSDESDIELLNESESQIMVPETRARSKDYFRKAPFAKDARSLRDGIPLIPQVLKEDSKDKVQNLVMSRAPVVLPWVGFGTYRLASHSKNATLKAIESGYRHIDTAFIYSRERTERTVGEAIQESISKGILKYREEIFVTTKHWRRYHGYEPSMECLRLSLQRLKTNYVDLWLMHWPGPAWKTKQKRQEPDDDEEDDDPWSMASTASSAEEMVKVRSETWRAMEDAYFSGKARAIGVCNFSVQHLENLRQTCRILPMVNQVELHPLYPQTALLEYCRKHGIVVEAYASLGGQDTGLVKWAELMGKLPNTSSPRNLLNAEAVTELASKYDKTPGQILLKWALQQNCVVIPKTSKLGRMEENAQLFDFEMKESEVGNLSSRLLQQVRDKASMVNDDEGKDRSGDDGEILGLTRLCWRGDPFRLLDFE